MGKLVLSLYDRTGNMVLPWAEAGYEVLAVDIATTGTDLRTWLPPRRDYEIVFAFPPCTHLAISGSRWFQEKGLSSLASAIELVERARYICEWSGAPWMIENPLSTLSTYWREPDHKFQPYDYAGLEAADHYCKKTCLWTGGGFVMPEPEPDLFALTPPDNRMHHAPDSKGRSEKRSVTPMGFARAVFKANAERGR